MKNNFIIFFLFFLTSCNTSVDISLNAEDLKKNGKTIISNSYLDNELFENKIAKVNLYPIEKKYDWNYANFNSYFFFKNVELDNNLFKLRSNKIFSKSKKNEFKNELVSYKDKIIFIDGISNLIITDLDLNIVDKLKIHKDIPSSIQIRSTLVAHDGIIYAADNLGTILAYDINKKQVLWRNFLGVPFLSNISIYKESIFITNSNGKLFSFNLDGKLNWTFETGTEIIKSFDAYKIVIFKDKLIFSNDLGYIYCLDLEKSSLLWSYRVPVNFHNSKSELFFLSNLIIEDNFLFLSSSFGNFIKINIATGQVIWQISLLTNNIAIVNLDTISILESNTFFTVIEKKTGNIIYKKDIKKYFDNQNIKDIIFDSFFVGSDTYYIISNSGFFIKIYSKDLSMVSQKKFSKTLVSNIVINNKKIYFIDSNGSINKFE